MGGSYSRSHRRISNGSGVSLRGADGHNFDHNQSQSQSHERSHDHDHPHSQNHSHNDNHGHDHAHTNSHAFESQPSGATPYTPTQATFDRSSYAAPEMSTAVFDQVAAPGSLSRFTEFLMQYTAQYPLVHAVMKEKDSRRIFYFMT